MSSGKRGRPKDPYTVQVVEALHEQFPKFTAVQMSLIRNPAYGLQLSAEAKEVLRNAGILPAEEKSRRKRLKNSERKKNERITFRLTSEEKVRFSEQVKKSGCKSVQEYLEKIIKENEL